MNQTLALLVDAYRELNARKMFWITLVLSALVVSVFAIVGINERGLTIFWWTLPGEELGLTSAIVPPDLLYKLIFVQFGIGFWLAWVATILALISTASIIPDLISGGAIDLVLSKPISRLRLFLTKYLGGLLFVTLQVTVFCIASFLVIGLRGGVWEPALFISIPLVVAFFSYLFAICVLLGLLTRSTIAALLLTMLAWFGLFMLNTADGILLMMKTSNEQRVVTIERGIEANQRAIEMWSERDPERVPDVRERLAHTEEELESAQRTGTTVRRIYYAIYGFKTVMPKTSETIGLLERWLIDLAELPGAQGNNEAPPGFNPDDPSFDPGQQNVALSVASETRSRSVWWIVGTSLLFEGVVLAFASWIFIRRDF